MTSPVSDFTTRYIDGLVDRLASGTTRAFAKSAEPGKVRSTGARIVTFTGDLYNVDESSDDPSQVPGHVGDSWSGLLVANELGGPCNAVTSGDYAPPPGSSHPGFDVGGHMTENADGTVTLGTCFLMPLCSWHNHKSRDGVPFALESQTVLKLTGYMQPEPAVTFLLRMPSDEPTAALVHEGDAWRHANLSEAEAESLVRGGLGAWPEVARVEGSGDEGARRVVDRVDRVILFSREAETNDLRLVYDSERGDGSPTP